MLKQSKIIDLFNTRAAAGYTFLAGNFTLLLSNFESLNLEKTLTAGLLIATSSLYPFTRRRPELFAPAGISLISAQSIIATTAKGAGETLQITGTVPPMIQGVLMIRKAYNAANDNWTFQTSTPLLKPLEWIDRKPIMAGAIIEGPGVATIAFGAALSHDWPLCAAASQWTAANVLLALSDREAAQQTPANKGPA